MGWLIFPGSTDVTCTGLGTASFNQTILNQQEAARRAAQNSRRRTSIIIGVVVSLVSLLSIVGAAGTWHYLRTQYGRPNLDIKPRQFDQFIPSGQAFSINNLVESGVITTPSPGKARSIPAGSHGSPHKVIPYTPEILSANNTRQPSGTGSVPLPVNDTDSHSQPSSVNPPAVSVRRSKGQETTQVTMSESRTSDRPGSLGPPILIRNGSVRGSRLTAASENELIYQHQDAGQAVRELPPPYICPPEAA